MNTRYLVFLFLLVIFQNAVTEEPKNFLVEYVRGAPGSVKGRLRASGRLSGTAETARELIAQLMANERRNDKLLYEMEHKFNTSPVNEECVLEEEIGVASPGSPIEIAPDHSIVAFYHQKKVTNVKDLEYGTPLLSIRDKNLDRGQRTKVVHKADADLGELKMIGKTLNDVHALTFVVLYRVETKEVAITGYKITKTSTKRIRDLMHEIHFGELEKNLKDKFEIKEGDDKNAKAQKKESFHNHKLTILKPENNPYISALLDHVHQTHANSVAHIMDPNGAPGTILKENEFIKDIILKHNRFKDSFVLGDVTYDPIWILMSENKDRSTDSTKWPHNPHAENHKNKVVGGQGEQREQEKEEKAEVVDGRDEKPEEGQVRGGK